jgi:phage terminase small subunit
MNASDAYREVYDVKRSTSKSVNEIASRLLKNVKVASMIAEIRARAEDTTILTVERTRAELARVCFSDVRKLCNPDGSLKKVNELDADTAAAVASFEVDEVEVGDKVVRRTIKVKLWDKNAALEKAIKHLGLYERETPSGRRTEPPGGAGGRQEGEAPARQDRRQVVFLPVGSFHLAATRPAFRLQVSPKPW